MNFGVFPKPKNDWFSSQMFFPLGVSQKLWNQSKIYLHVLAFAYVYVFAVDGSSLNYFRVKIFGSWW